jgi:enoyl-CoA hydratase/carnithine racemase
MEELLVNREGTMTRLTLNRPAKANALSAALVEALIAAVDAAEADGTRLLVVDGAGPHFCAGFDFSDYETASEGDLALRFVRIETLLQALYHAPFDTLALAHGKVFGAGADIVASCSTRVGAPDAAFLMPGLRFGVVLGTRRFAARVGGDKAREILSASRPFGAEEALRINFLTELARKERWGDIAEAARAGSERLSREAAAALRAATIADTRAEDMAALAVSVSSPGIKDRIRAFRETRR